MLSPELAVIIPTYNERANLEPLLEGLEEVLKGVSWEAVFVDDDSPDGTADALRTVAAKDERVRVIHRIGRRGLSSACVEGMMATSAPYLAVMDADLQHDEALLPNMLRLLREHDADLVVGTRYAGEGSTGDWSRRRRWMSRIATRSARTFLGVNLSDPMSGFFMLKRSFLDSTVRRLSGKGFKILLDLCVSAPVKPKVRELPYTFRTRRAGESKLNSRVIAEYALLLADHTFGRWIPVRFVLFVIAGTGGALLHLAILSLGIFTAGAPFWAAQTIATLLAMTLNYILNNTFTWADRPLKGLRFLWGLVTFYAACGVGAVINIQIAVSLHDTGTAWWLAGLLGAVVGAVWNYAVTSALTWKTQP